MGLEIKVTKKQEGEFVISPVGSIDSVTYLELEKVLLPILKSFCKVLVFNMEGINYISSLGIGVFIKTRKLIQERGGIFIMSNLLPQIKMAFDVIKALPATAVFADLKEVDEYLSAIQKKAIEREKGAL